MNISTYRLKNSSYPASIGKQSNCQLTTLTEITQMFSNWYDRIILLLAQSSCAQLCGQENHRGGRRRRRGVARRAARARCALLQDAQALPQVRAQGGH